MEDDIVPVAAELAHGLAVFELYLDAGHATQPASELQRIEELRLEAAVLARGDEVLADLSCTVAASLPTVTASNT